MAKYIYIYNRNYCTILTTWPWTYCIWEYPSCTR